MPPSTQNNSTCRNALSHSCSDASSSERVRLQSSILQAKGFDSGSEPSSELARSEPHQWFSSFDSDLRLQQQSAENFITTKVRLGTTSTLNALGLSKFPNHSLLGLNELFRSCGKKLACP